MAKNKKGDLNYLNKDLPETEYEVLYPTGFFGYDVQNGYRVYDNNQNRYVYNMGIPDGSFVGIIGRTNCGKSTFSIQLAGNIVRPFDNSRIIHFEIEQGASGDNKNMALLGMDVETYNKKYKRYNSSVTIEFIEKKLEEEMSRKLENLDEYRYDTGKVNYKGEPIYKFVPTVCIIDSVANLGSDKFSSSTDRTNMDAAQITNVLTSFFKKYGQRIRSYNIIILGINHVRKKINTDFFPQKSEIPGLKNDETVPGGSIFKYQSTAILRLDDQSAKFTADDEFGVEGGYVNIIAAKTRHGSLKNSSKLFFNGKDGFIGNLSNFLMLWDNGVITQSGAYFNMPGYDKKFTKKQFIKLLEEDKEFAECFNKLIAKYIEEKILTWNDYSEEEESENYIDKVFSYLN